MIETIVKNNVRINVDFYKAFIKEYHGNDEFISEWRNKYNYNTLYPNIITTKGYFKMRPTFEIKYVDVHFFIRNKKSDTTKMAKEWLRMTLCNVYCSTYHQNGEMAPESFILAFLRLYDSILVKKCNVVIPNYDNKQELLFDILTLYKNIKKSKNIDTKCIEITQKFCSKYKMSNTEYTLNKDNVLVRSFIDTLSGNKLRSYFETKMYSERLVEVINNNRNRILSLEDAVEIIHQYEDVELCKIYTKSKKSDGIHPFLNIDVRKLEDILKCDRKLSKIKQRKDIERDIALNRWLLDGSSPERIKEIEKLTISVRTIYNIISAWKSNNNNFQNCCIK